VLLLAVSAAVLAAALTLGPGSESRRAGSGSVSLPAFVDRSMPPVVMVVFDELPVDALRRPDGGIDAARFPHLARFARRATWFPNTVAAHDSTPYALPSTMDGRRARQGVRATSQGHPSSVFTLLGDLGYRLAVNEEATDVCPERLCHGNAAERLGILDNLEANGREERLARFTRSISASARPTLYFKHVLLPHLPWVYLPSGRRVRGALGHLAGPEGFHDAGLTRHNYARLLRQLGYVDLQMGRLFARLRRAGLYDDALVVLTADHGISFEHGVADRRKLSESNIDEVAPVPFFIKAPGQHASRVEPAYARTYDVVPTMADVLDLTLPWAADGRSAFGESARRRDTVRVPRRSFRGAVTISAPSLTARRRENMRRRASIFQTGAESLRRFGDPYASLQRIGPHARLVGRPLAAAGPIRRGPVRVELRGSDWLSDVDTRSDELPLQVAGRVPASRPETTRVLAAEVNGRVAATGRTFWLRGPPGTIRPVTGIETFSLDIPEGALRRGRNRLRIVEVRRRRATLAFRTVRPVYPSEDERLASRLRRAMGHPAWPRPLPGRRSPAGTPSRRPPGAGHPRRAAAPRARRRLHEGQAGRARGPAHGRELVPRPGPRRGRLRPRRAGDLPRAGPARRLPDHARPRGSGIRAHDGVGDRGRAR